MATRTRSKAQANNASSNLDDIIIDSPTTNIWENLWIEYANTVIYEDTCPALEYADLIKDPKYATEWTRSAAHKFGRLAQGIKGSIKGTDTIFFIPKSTVPKGRKVTYGKFVCNIRPQKAGPYRMRLTIGGDQLDYPGIVYQTTADIITAKCLFNSIISTPNAKYLGIDLNDFYLQHSPVVVHHSTNASDGGHSWFYESGLTDHLTLILVGAHLKHLC